MPGIGALAHTQSGSSTPLGRSLRHLLLSPLVPQVSPGFPASPCPTSSQPSLPGRWGGGGWCLVSAVFLHSQWGPGAEWWSFRADCGGSCLTLGLALSRHVQAAYLNGLPLGGDMPVAHSQSQYVVCPGAEV